MMLKHLETGCLHCHHRAQQSNMKEDPNNKRYKSHQDNTQPA